jgi:hypothetical protein
MCDPRPFNIRIHAAEGISSGLRLIDKRGWEGLGVVCPKGRLSKTSNREEFSGSGVYILLGNEEHLLPSIYIGQAENLRRRLSQHFSQKDFWQQVIFFTTKKDPLNKSELQFLESSLIRRAQNYRRCHLENGNTPHEPPLSEADKADAEGFLLEMLSVLPLLGVKEFEPLEEAPEPSEKFQMEGKRYSATGFESSNGFVVCKGSRASQRVSESGLDKGYEQLRQELIDEKVLLPEGDQLVFQVDYEFRNASPAAAILAGYNMNGLKAWKDASGVTLSEYRKRSAARMAGNEQESS